MMLKRKTDSRQVSFPLNFDDAEFHIELLTGNPDAKVLIVTKDDDGERLKRDSKIAEATRKAETKFDFKSLEGPYIASKYDRLDRLARWIKDRQRLGCGVFVLVHDNGGVKARTHEAIKAVRALWHEDDTKRGAPRDDFPLLPSFDVQSSPGKYHSYWLLDKPGTLEKDAFEGCQLRIVEDYTGDKGARHLAQILRLAGSWNLKPGREPWQVQAYAPEGAIALYTAAELRAAFPPKGKPRAVISNGHELADAEQVQSALDVVRSRCEEGYYDWLEIGMALHAWGKGSGEALNMWREVCPDPEECEAKWGSFKRQGPDTVGIGTLFHYAEKEGWRMPNNGIAALAKQQGKPTERPEIEVKAGYHDLIVADCESALKHAGLEVYERGGMLVRPIREARPDCNGEAVMCPAFTPVTAAWLRLAAATHINFKKFNVKADELRATDPPRDVIEAMLARRGDWPWPSLAGLAAAPTLRADGSVLNEEGYDEATGLYMFQAMELNMPERPTRDDAERAADVLDDLLAEFPFVDDASYSVGMSILITPSVRPMMDVAPMHFVTATAPGSGKSELLNVMSMIALGVKCPAMSAGWSDEELEKRLGMDLLSGCSIISIDNVVRDLGGDALCQVVEQPIVKARVLGKSEKIEVVNRHSTFANGNNAGPRGDLIRRSLVAGMDAEMERPHEREFKGDPCKAVRGARERYVAACLTLVRAYLLAGRPKVTKRPMNSFAGWSDTVRSALIWIGYADPCETMETARDNDPETTQLRQFLHAFRQELGEGPANAYSAGELAAMADGLRHPNMREALAGFMQGSAVSTQKLGKWLRTSKGRRLAGAYLENRQVAGNRKWYVVEV